MYGLIYGVDGANFPDVAETGPYESREEALAAVDVGLVQRFRGVGLVANWQASDGADISTGAGNYAGGILSVEHCGGVPVIEVDRDFAALHDVEELALSYLGAEIRAENEVVASSGRLRYPLTRWVSS